MQTSQEIVSRLRNSAFLSLGEAESLIRVALDNADIDTIDRHHSFFFYEIRPIFSVAKYLKANAMQFTDRPDGIIQIGHNNLNIECTRDLNAQDGYQESLRMELLKRDGSVPAFQPIVATGTKNNRKFEPTPLVARLIDWEKIAEEKSKKFSEALNRKSSESDTHKEVLIITFDDMEHPRSKEKFLLPISRFWNAVKDSCVFSRVFLVGDSQNFLWDSHQPDAVVLTAVLH